MAYWIENDIWVLFKSSDIELILHNQIIIIIIIIIFFFHLRTYNVVELGHSPTL